MDDDIKISQDGAPEADAPMQEWTERLEARVSERTLELEHVVELLNQSNAQLSQAHHQTERARNNLYNAIEALEEGFALFDANDVKVMCNSRFCSHMPDVIPKLVPGLTFKQFVDAVSGSRYLTLPEETSPQLWAKWRMQLHRDHSVKFSLHLTDDSCVQVRERRTPDGGTVIVQSDVTDIMLAQQQERNRMRNDQESVVRATFDHLQQGIAIFVHSGHLAYLNTPLAVLLGLRPEQLPCGAHYSYLVKQLHGRIKPPSAITLKRLDKWLRAGSTPREPMSFEIVTNGEIWLDVFVRNLPDGRFLVSATDVTHERSTTLALARVNETLEQRVSDRTIELEEALRMAKWANASKTRFVAAASHDLLQPLSAAKLYLESGSDHDPDGILGKAGQALESVETIIRALLDISRLDSDDTDLEVGLVRLDSLFQTLRNEFEPLAQSKNLRLRIVDSTWAVRSNPGYLRSILQNLISNAIRYTQEGKVLVGARRNGGSVCVEVWDTGPGIAEAQRGIIFEEFCRLQTRASAAEGMGLGLAIVRRACERLDHPLGMWSVVGKGTGFFVNLPLIEDKTDSRNVPSRRHEPLRRPQLALRGIIVLLIENDADLRRALSILLGRWQINVLDVACLSEALALLDEIQISPDVMLVDYHLEEEENGLDLIKAVTQLLGPIPSRIISADRSLSVRRQCLQAGIPLIYKPIDAKILEGSLVSALSVSS